MRALLYRKTQPTLRPGQQGRLHDLSSREIRQHNRSWRMLRMPPGNKPRRGNASTGTHKREKLHGLSRPLVQSNLWSWHAMLPMPKGSLAGCLVVPRLCRRTLRKCDGRLQQLHERRVYGRTRPEIMQEMRGRKVRRQSRCRRVFQMQSRNLRRYCRRAQLERRVQKMSVREV